MSKDLIAVLMAKCQDISDELRPPGTTRRPLHGLTSSTHKACSDIVKEYYKNTPGVNFDEIRVWGIHITQEIETMDSFGRIKKETTFVIDLRFGNLYTFVLVEGIVIPYSEWLYEEKIYLAGVWYYWNQEDKCGTTKTLSQAEQFAMLTGEDKHLKSFVGTDAPKYTDK